MATPSNRPSDTPPPPGMFSSGPTPIGVPELVRTPDGIDQPFAARTTRPAGQGVYFDALPGADTSGEPMRSVEPRYYTGHEVALFANRPIDDVARIQFAMEAAGLLESGKYTVGEWGGSSGPSAEAIKTVLGHANAHGFDWGESLQRLIAAAPLAEEEGAEFVRGRYVAGEFVQDPFLPEDTDTLTQRIKQQFRQVLGRDPDAGEIGKYVSGLAAADQEAYQQNLAAARATFSATEDARRRQFGASEDERSRQFYEAEGQRVGTPGFQTRPALDPNDPNTQGGRGAPIDQPGAFQKVDPIASFVERWERDYAPEIDRRQRVTAAADNRVGLMETIRSLDAAIGA